MPEPEGLQTTVHEVRKNVANLLEAERKAQGATPSASVPPPVKPPTSDKPVRSTTVAPACGHSGTDSGRSRTQRTVDCLRPAGNGQDILAQKATLDLAAYWAFGKAFEKLTEDDKRVVVGGDQGNGLVRICCFHPAYGYEDFIEGYRPETHNGQVAFQLRDGVFKRFAKDAAQEPDREAWTRVRGSKPGRVALSSGTVAVWLAVRLGIHVAA